MQQNDMATTTRGTAQKKAASSAKRKPPAKDAVPTKETDDTNGPPTGSSTSSSWSKSTIPTKSASSTSSTGSKTKRGAKVQKSSKSKRSAKTYQEGHLDSLKYSSIKAYFASFEKFFDTLDYPSIKDFLLRDFLPSLKQSRAYRADWPSGEDFDYGIVRPEITKLLLNWEINSKDRYDLINMLQDARAEQMELLRDAAKLGAKFAGDYHSMLIRNYLHDTEKLRPVDMEFSSVKDRDYFFNQYIKDFPRSKSPPISLLIKKPPTPRDPAPDFTVGNGLGDALRTSFGRPNSSVYAARRRQVTVPKEIERLEQQRGSGRTNTVRQSSRAQNPGCSIL